MATKTAIVLFGLVFWGSGAYASDITDCLAGVSYDETVAACTTAIDSGDLVDADLAEALSMRGRAHLRHGDAGVAFIDLSRARALDPETPDRHYHLALAEKAIGLTTNAAFDIREATGRENEYVYWLAGGVLSMMFSWETQESDWFFRNALEANGEGLTARFLLAFAEHLFTRESAAELGVRLREAVGNGGGEDLIAELQRLLGYAGGTAESPRYAGPIDGVLNSETIAATYGLLHSRHSHFVIIGLGEFVWRTKLAY